MRQGLFEDRGYRTVEAGGSSTRDESDVEATARRSSPGQWDENLGNWGSEIWNLPGMGDAGSGCGEWYPDAVCQTCGEPTMASRTCGSRSCPDCWGVWAKDAAVRATVRIQSFRHTQPANHKRQVAHAYVSPSEGDVMNKRQFWEGKKRAAEIAEEKGFRGFTVIGHPWRPTEEAKARFKAEVPRDDEDNPEYGIWVWLRNDVENIRKLTYWSPHYHIIGATSAGMEAADKSDDWVYRFERSLESYEGVADKDSHEDVYGVFRYLLSHAGFPEGSTRQVTTWYSELANNVFVEDATEDWQHAKPCEDVREDLQVAVEEVAGPDIEDDAEAADSADEGDDKGDCPVDDCTGFLIDVFDVSQYLRQSDPPPDVRDMMIAARDWRLGRIQPPPGLKRPTTEDEAREALEELL